MFAVASWETLQEAACKHMVRSISCRKFHEGPMGGYHCLGYQTYTNRTTLSRLLSTIIEGNPSVQQNGIESTTDEQPLFLKRLMVN